MLVQMLDKQRRAVCVVKTALSRLGMHNRSICVTAQNWSFSFGSSGDYFAVFISGPEGNNVEPFYHTGGSIAEAVKNALNALKGRHGSKSVDQTDLAPF